MLLHLLPKLTPMEQFKQIVEKAIADLGYDVEKARVEDKNYHWIFKEGSATIAVELFELETDKRPFIVVYSYMMTLPPNNLPEFLAELLILNSVMVVASFMLEENKIYLKADRDLNGADVEEIKYIINKVAFYADKWDDYLINKYSDKISK